MAAIIGVAAALVVGVGAVMLWSRSPARTDVSSTVQGVTPNDTSRPASDSGRSVAASATTSPPRRAPGPEESKATPPRSTSKSSPAPAPASPVPASVISETSRPRDTSTAKSPDESAAGARATLNELKAAIADPDAVASAGNGPAILDRIDRLLPALTSRADSVEATYYAVEVNLILDKPAVACRLLNRIRSASRGTSYQVSVDRFLADTELACASRR